MSAKVVSEQLIAARVIPVLRFAARAQAEAAIDCLLAAGFATVEVTMTTPDAVSLIGDLRRHSPSAFLVGAGTVLDVDMARACLRAGADYFVSPGFVPGLAELAHAAHRPCLMGGFTPSEVLAARRAGADIVKVFPASTGGPKHLAAMHAVYPHIPMCPTGGVSLENMRDYFAAGAAVVGVGNNLIDVNALTRGDRNVVIAHAQQFLDAARNITRA
jgi:2-dehydro-3-deoxyphosphogluconate aldolase/(4S)-4-hydroxy-2-oxoglutarate aldolase